MNNPKTQPLLNLAQTSGHYSGADRAFHHGRLVLILVISMCSWINKLNLYMKLGMHRSEFFSPDTDSNTWALGIDRYPVPI